MYMVQPRPDSPYDSPRASVPGTLAFLATAIFVLLAAGMAGFEAPPHCFRLADDE